MRRISLKRSSRSKRYKLTRRSRKWTRTAKLPKSVAAAVKQIVARQEETKFVSYTPINNVAHNSTITAGDFYRVLPHIFQGATEFQRTGDKCTPVSLTVRGHVAVNRDKVNANRAIMVRILVLQLKDSKSYSVAAGSWAANYARLLKQNDESGVENIAFSGNANELYLPVNRDLFEVLGERYIRLSELAEPGMSVEAAPIGSIAKSFNIKITKMPKTLTFTSGGQNEPTNFAPFMCFGYAYMDGTVADTGAFTGLEVNAQSHLYFKDP